MIIVTMERKMRKIPKQEYTAEFKELAVRRVKDGQSAGAVAKDLGLIEQTLRNWVKAFDAGKLNGAGGKKVTPEDMELSRLRAENIRLRRELEIIKKAAAYFAKDAL
jgi:transposase